MFPLASHLKCETSVEDVMKISPVVPPHPQLLQMFVWSFFLRLCGALQANVQIVMQILFLFSNLPHLSVLRTKPSQCTCNNEKSFYDLYCNEKCISMPKCIEVFIEASYFTKIF